MTNHVFIDDIIKELHDQIAELKRERDLMEGARDFEKERADGLAKENSKLEHWFVDYVDPFELTGKELQEWETLHKKYYPENYFPDDVELEEIK